MKTAISIMLLLFIISIGSEVPSTSGRPMLDARAITTTSSSKYMQSHLLGGEKGRNELGPTSQATRSNHIQSSNTSEEDLDAVGDHPHPPKPHRRGRTIIQSSNTSEEAHVMIMPFVAVPKLAVQAVVFYEKDIGSIHMMSADSPGAIGDKNDTKKSDIEWALNTWGKWVLLVLAVLSVGLTVHCTFNCLVSKSEADRPMSTPPATSAVRN